MKMPSLNAIERHDHIRKIVDEQGQVSVGQLADQLGVSQVTVRSDLEQLERNHVLKRIRGGAISHNKQTEKPFDITVAENTTEKMLIASEACKLITEHQTLMLDVGTTTTQLATQLANTFKHLTIITNALNIAMYLETHSSFTVIVSGGTLRRMQHSLVNPYGTEILKKLHVDVLFLGCNGVTVENGVTNSNLQEAEIKSLMVDMAQRVIVLADHSKIGVDSTAQCAHLSKVDTLITDHQADAQTLNSLTKQGVQVIRAC